MLTRFAAALTVFALVAVACGDSAGTTTTTSAAGPFPDNAFAVVASSDIAQGRERLLIGIATPDGGRLAAPDKPITATVWPEDDPSAKQTVAGEFMWAVEGASGLYRAYFDFDAPGLWRLEVTPEGAAPLPSSLFTVLTAASTPEVGEPAPLSETVTIDDAPLTEITTDPQPDEDFYRLSVADAVTSGRPSVIIFATPKFCTSAVCGPTLETMRSIAPDFPDANWVHVEVFTNLDDPENLEVVPAVGEWGLPTEPWIFVVAADGTIAGRFEGIVAREELTPLLGG